MKKLMLLLFLLPMLAMAQSSKTFISFSFAPASTKYIVDNNEDSKSMFGGHYGISMGKLKNKMSYSAGVGLLFTGMDYGFAKASDKQIIIPFEFGFFPVSTGVQPFVKISLVPSYLFSSELDGEYSGNIGELYQDNANKWNLSAEGSAGIRIPLKTVGFLDIGAGYFRGFTSIQKNGDQLPQAISGIVTLTSLIK
jgi:hypothetical protein